MVFGGKNADEIPSDLLDKGYNKFRKRIMLWEFQLKDYFPNVDPLIWSGWINIVKKLEKKNFRQ